MKLMLLYPMREHAKCMRRQVVQRLGKLPLEKVNFIAMVKN